jgi:hypothetical protein
MRPREEVATMSNVYAPPIAVVHDVPDPALALRWPIAARVSEPRFWTASASL